jgi:transcription elongation factor Elf1
MTKDYNWLDEWTRIVLKRRDFIYRNVPRCQKCNHEQVQIVDTAKPARWRCRICKHRFEYEPET